MKKTGILLLTVLLLCACAGVRAEDKPVRCTTKEEVRAAVGSCADSGAESFQISCPAGLAEELKDGGELFAWLGFHGVEDCSLQYTVSDPVTFFFSDLRRFSVPFRAVSDDNGFLNAVDDMSRAGAESFVIGMDMEYYTTLETDPDRLQLLLNSSQLETWGASSHIPALCCWTFDQAVYSQMPKLLCRTEEELTAAVRGMGAAGSTSFQLIMPTDLYHAVAADGFAGLQQLTAEAGMTNGGELLYRPGVIIYENAVIRSDLKKITTPAEAAEQAVQCVTDGKQEISLYCTPELFTQLLEDGTESLKGKKLLLISDVAVNAGIADYSWTQSSASGIINLQILSLFPGARMLNAARSGNLSSLTERERMTLEKAEKTADELSEGKESLLDIAEAIHDWLCDLIDYCSDDGWDEDDSAIGAILEGKANCDGYADAFYLLGNLAGLDVRYQYGDGDTGKKDLPDFDLPDPDDEEDEDEELHMWNLMKIDGTWRVADLTWDDQESGICQTWFNIGEDRASRVYIRNRETGLPLLAETDLSTRPANEYLIGGGWTAEQALQDAAGRGFTDFEWIWADTKAADCEEALRLLDEHATVSWRYTWNNQMGTLTVHDYR